MPYEHSPLKFSVDCRVTLILLSKIESLGNFQELLPGVPRNLS